jgi:aspartate aminotransferase
MTGWRIGYMGGCADVISAATRIQSQSTSNPNSIAQKAAVEAICGPQDHVETMVREFEKRRNYLVERLSRLKDVTCLSPQGAFYAFPNFSKYYNGSLKGKKVSGSLELADLLLEHARLAAVPGIAFGEDACIRLSFATSMDNLKKGVDRIEETLSAITS